MSGLLAFAFAINAGGYRVSAGTTVPVGDVVDAKQRVSMDQIDHSVLDALLKRYVNKDGQVDYRKWSEQAADLRALDGYLIELSRAELDVKASRQAVLAYWINAYNAVTLKGILREYPTTSIRNHTAKIVGYNIWKDLKLQVDGRQVSLDDIEHQVLRKLGEPRIHFAIVCASISCPKLRNEAFLAEKLEEQLADNARDFFADSGKFTFDVKSRRLGLSKILSWFGEDFGSTRREQMQFIAPYVPAESRSLLLDDSAKVFYLDYDWGLNDVE
ncbi:MAG: DUF547 domain-containing protein [Planctomycetota bacterium]